MSVGDHQYRVAKWKARITTSDPTTGRIEAVMGDAYPRQISVSGISAATRWPKEGEVWTVRQENQGWVLGERWQDDTEDFKTSDLQPGEMLLDSTEIKNANGDSLAIWSPGDIKLVAYVTPDPGWLLCNGQIVTIDHPALRARLLSDGSPHGVDGSGNPKVPDLVGRAPVGAGTGSGLSAKTLGTKIGVETPTMPAHTTGPMSANAGKGYDAFVSLVNAGAAFGLLNQASIDHTHAVAGVGSAVDGNVPPSAVINFVIKT